MTQRRHRVRASDIAKSKKPSWFNLILLAIALFLVIAFKMNVGDSTADFFQSLTADPSTELPEARALPEAEGLKVEGPTEGPTAEDPTAEDPTAEGPAPSPQPQP